MASCKVQSALADNEGEPPWCSQRHGCWARPLVRFAAAGNGVAMHQGIPLGEHVKFAWTA